jgi:CheY-like chemotaxis protein/HPt (histidine-containing phosphotransfer) domain-containing protein
VLDSGLAADQREQLETAQRCAYSLLGLLNDILDLSKIEAGKMVFERIPFNVRAVLADCVKSQKAKATQKKLDLRFVSDPKGRFDILGDPLRLRQIVANLLSNALKFTEKGSVVVELTSMVGTGVGTGDRALLQIQVRDTGSGIPADKLPAIFEKFTQADGSITRKYGGTGLGLAITQRLADMHGGGVSVESEVGQGSTFTVTLPCELAPAAEPDAPAQKGEEMVQSSPDLSSARLLLVEDNLVNQKVVLAILRKKGYQIDVANHGGEALAMLEKAQVPYRLILMDVQMPVMDGLEATRAIRRDARWDNVPIVAMTAHAMNGDRERCLQAGMDAYISKPVQPAHLVSTIEKHLDASAHQPVSRAANPPASPIERVLTDRLMNGDSELMTGMLQLFLQIAPERLEKLENAAARADSGTLAQEAKMISAAAEQLASQGLGDCAQRIELAASNGDFEQVKVYLETLRREIRSLEALTT